MPQATEPVGSNDMLGAFFGVGRVLKRLGGSGPVDGPTLGVLFEIDRHAPVRLGDVAVACGLDASTVSRHVAALEREEHVTREPDPADGRASRLVLTDVGKAALAAAMERRRAVVDAALQEWSDIDRAHLRRLLERLAEDMSAVTSSAQPSIPRADPAGPAAATPDEGTQ